MWRLCGWRLSRSHVLVIVSFCAASRRCNATTNYGESQKARVSKWAAISTTEIISTLHLVLIHLLFCFLQRTNASRSGFKFAGNSTALWIVWHENASSQRYRRCSAKFGRCSHGHCGIPRHHTNQHILLGKNTKDFIQTKTFSRQTASRRIRTSLAPPFFCRCCVSYF